MDATAETAYQVFRIPELEEVLDLVTISADKLGKSKVELLVSSVEAAFTAGVLAVASEADTRKNRSLLVRAKLMSTAYLNPNWLNDHQLPEVPDVIPFPEHCAPRDGEAEPAKSHETINRTILVDFKSMGPEFLEELSGKVALRYAETRAAHVDGLQLLLEFEAFRNKQLANLQQAVDSGDLRPPGMELHAYCHYFDDIMRAHLEQ